MINSKIETFLEQHNMEYLFLLLSNEEVQRLNKLPNLAKHKYFEKKLTEVALEHVALNIIPDYVAEEDLFEEEEVE